MKQNISTAFYWGMLHGINDWVAGFLLAHYMFDVPQQQSFIALVIYAVLAFGGQLPLGLWLDKNRNLKSFGIVSIILLLIACLVALFDPFSAIIIAGMASAGVHVVGGTVCLMLNKEKFTPLGIFTAPGVAGLTLGGFCGMINGNWILLPLIIAALLFILIIHSGFPVYQLRKNDNGAEIDRHDMLMMLILLVMCLRSLLYDLLNSFSGQIEYGLLIVGLSAFAGKIMGGLLADKIGWKRWIYITLPVSFVLLQLGNGNIIAMAFGVACLQSSVPVTLQLMYNSIPAYPATASALSLGTAVAIAGLPLYGYPNLIDIFNSSMAIYVGLVTAVLMAVYFAFFLFVKKA